MWDSDTVAAAAAPGGGARDSTRDSEDWHKVSGSRDSGSEGGSENWLEVSPRARDVASKHKARRRESTPPESAGEYV